MAIIFVLILLSIFFYIGQRLHTCLMGLGDRIYDSSWYQYPPKVQQCVLVIMTRTQQPFYITAYGMIKCDLKAFSQVKSSTDAFNYVLFIQKLLAMRIINLFTGAQYDIFCLYGNAKDLSIRMCPVWPQRRRRKFWKPLAYSIYFHLIVKQEEIMCYTE